MIVLLGIISLFYAGLILFLLFGFTKVEEQTEAPSNPSARFSIVIPYRNEEENLSTLFNSLLKLKYPKEFFEILLVNDASEDASEDICFQFKEDHPDWNIVMLNSRRISGSPKKDAISTAVEMSKNDYILTTDADCSVPANWLLELNSFIQKTGSKMVAGPVKLCAGKKRKTDFLKLFEEMDFLSLQGATIGGFGVDSPFMCNGANLCYEKASFEKVNGFAGNDSIASGDDIFLLEKFQKAGLCIGFLKSHGAIVSTGLQPNLRRLVSQRIRWAGKTSVYNNSFGKTVGVIVLLMNLSLLLGLGAVFAGVFPQRAFLLFFLIKFNVDFLLIYKTSIFFRREKLMKNYFWCSFIYPFFSSYVAVNSLFRGYIWKGRNFKR